MYALVVHSICFAAHLIRLAGWLAGRSFAVAATSSVKFSLLLRTCKIHFMSTLILICESLRWTAVNIYTIFIQCVAAILVHGQRFSFILDFHPFHGSVRKSFFFSSSIFLPRVSSSHWSLALVFCIISVLWHCILKPALHRSQSAPCHLRSTRCFVRLLIQ